MTLAILRSPVGVVRAFERRASELKQPEAQLLERAGVSPTQWRQFQDALAAVDGDVFRRVLSVAGLHATIAETPTTPDFIGQTPEGQIHTRHGALG